MKYLPIFLLLLGCHASKWQYHEIDGNINSSRLSYKESPFLSKVEIEFLQIQGTIYGYINLFKQIMVPSGADPTKAKITYLIEDKKFNKMEKLCKGGQRIALGKGSTQLIINSLLDKQKVEIIGDSFTISIDPLEFSKEYRYLIKKRNMLEKAFFTFKRRYNLSF